MTSTQDAEKANKVTHQGTASFMKHTRARTRTLTYTTRETEYKQRTILPTLMYLVMWIQ